MPSDSSSSSKKKLFLLFISLTTIVVVFALILFIGALSKNDRPGQNAVGSPVPTVNTDPVRQSVFPATTVVDGVTRVSLLHALDTLMAAGEAVNWTGNNPGWSLVSAHTESADAGGRSQYWDIVCMSENSTLIAGIQEDKVVFTSVLYADGSSSAGAGRPVDSTVVMSAVLAAYNLDKSPQSALITINYEGSGRVYLIGYDDPANPARSFDVTLDGDTGRMVSDRVGP